MNDLSEIKTEPIHVSDVEAQNGLSIVQFQNIESNELPTGSYNEVSNSDVEMASTPSKPKIYIYHTGLVNPCIIRPVLGSKKVYLESGTVQILCDPNTLYTIEQNESGTVVQSHHDPKHIPFMEVQNPTQVSVYEPDNFIVVKEEHDDEEIDSHQETEDKTENIVTAINDSEPIAFYNMDEGIMKPELEDNSNPNSVNSVEDDSLDEIKEEVMPIYIENTINEPPSDLDITLDDIKQEIRPRFVGNNVDDPQSEVELSSDSDDGDPVYRVDDSVSDSYSDSDDSDDSDYEVNKTSSKKKKEGRQNKGKSDSDDIIQTRTCLCPDVFAINHNSTNKLKLKCSMCTTKFECLFHLRAHLEIHSLPYECSVCYNRFPMAINEDIHFRYKHVDKEFRFLCRLCNVNYKQEKNFNFHWPNCYKKVTDENKRKHKGDRAESNDCSIIDNDDKIQKKKQKKTVKK